MKVKNHTVNIQLAGEIIEILQRYSIVDSENPNPYDVENWAEEYLCNHSNLFETGKFKEE